MRLGLGCLVVMGLPQSQLEAEHQQQQHNGASAGAEDDHQPWRKQERDLHGTVTVNCPAIDT